LATLQQADRSQLLISQSDYSSFALRLQLLRLLFYPGVPTFKGRQKLAPYSNLANLPSGPLLTCTTLPSGRQKSAPYSNLANLSSGPLLTCTTLPSGRQKSAPYSNLAYLPSGPLLTCTTLPSVPPDVGALFKPGQPPFRHSSHLYNSSVRPPDVGALFNLANLPSSPLLTCTTLPSGLPEVGALFKPGQPYLRPSSHLYSVQLLNSSVRSPEVGAFFEPGQASLRPSSHLYNLANLPPGLLLTCITLPSGRQKSASLLLHMLQLKKPPMLRISLNMYSADSAVQ